MRHRYRTRRRGAVAVLTALLMIVLLAMLAFALDIGYIQVTRTQMQRSADAAAVAGVWELIDENYQFGVTGNSQAADHVRAAAEEYAGYNVVLTKQPQLGSSDVEVGYLANPSNPNEPMTTTGIVSYNAVRIHVRRAAQQNGSIPLVFGSMLGVKSTEAECQATAAFVSNFAGFGSPTDGSNLNILPFALDLDTWNNMLAGGGTDTWRWNPASQTVVAGSDGILEVNLFPQGTGSPGNRGTVDIGSSNNSTADIARQILYGVSASDLAHHGGKLEFDSQGELFLNGDTGISAGVKDELATLVGKVRMIPVFRQVVHPGNNATYTIVKFVGVRILEVNLTGKMSSKRVIVQPAAVVAKGGIPSQSTTLTSNYIYSPPWLVR